MKDHISRKVDELGRIVIPSDFRSKLDIKVGDKLHVAVVDNTLVLTKSVPVCTFCGSEKKLNYEQNNKYLCDACVKKISRTFR
jgi:transcriptional pleiotropic regulator of transition state genes